MHYLAGLNAHALRRAPRWPARRSTATGATAPSRWPPTAPTGRATTAARCCACSAAQDKAPSRIENRIGEPTANPYLYLASQLFAGLDGIERRLDPGPSADTPYETPADPLPRTLRDALACLRADATLVDLLGPAFVDYYAFIKEAEIDALQPRSERMGTARVLRHVLAVLPRRTPGPRRRGVEWIPASAGMTVQTPR